MNGIIVVNKEEGYTSRDIVNITGKVLNIKKIGHTGTLDPLATGVLVLCVGKATKLVEIMMNHDKEYIAEIMLGIDTDTLDITGNKIAEENVHISKENIEKVLNSYIKTYNQEVPLYSAVKVKGKKLYEYARKHQQVSLPKKEVTIYDLKLISDVQYKYGKTIFKIKTHVSKGTYIRSLIRDIAQDLNTIGVMTSLVRTRQGIYTLEQSNSLEDIKNNNIKILDLKSALANYKEIKVNSDMEFKIRNGQILDNIYNEDVVLFTDKNGKPISLYKKSEKNSQKIKSWKSLY